MTLKSSCFTNSLSMFLIIGAFLSTVFKHASDHHLKHILS